MRMETEVFTPKAKSETKQTSSSVIQQCRDGYNGAQARMQRQKSDVGQVTRQAHQQQSQ